MQCDVDQLADIVGVALPVDRLEGSLLGQIEPLEPQLALNPLGVAAKFALVRRLVVEPQVTDVLPEQEDEDVILVLCRIDDAPEGVARLPRGIVQAFLVHGVHQAAPLTDRWTMVERVD